MVIISPLLIQENLVLNDKLIKCTILHEINHNVPLFFSIYIFFFNEMKYFKSNTE